MKLRVVCMVAFAACASSPAYQLSTLDRYEVGEDATIAVSIRKTSNDHAMLIITRPDGSELAKKVELDAAHTNVRFGGSVDPAAEPTFTKPGDYKVELRRNETVLANQEIHIAVDRLTSLFPDEEVAGFALVGRSTRTRTQKQKTWKTYAAVYENPLNKDAVIQVVIEEPGDALTTAWQQYEDEGTLGVIENSNVRLRERAGSAMASWIAGKQIVSVRAATLADVQRGFIGHFLARYPSKL